MFTDPLKNLKAFGLLEDNIVADLGAGTGYYTITAGTLVPRGKVYAVEVVRDFLETIRKKAEEMHLHNVEALLGNIEKEGGTKLGEGIIDAVIASNILFEVEDKEQFILEIKRILKSKGRVLLVDWLPESSGIEFKMAIPKHKAREMFEKRGFALEREINAGTHHYGMILVKG